MPIESCPLPGGKSGFRWGDHGKCYSSREDAVEQGRAARANGYIGDDDAQFNEADHPRDGSGKFGSGGGGKSKTGFGGHPVGSREESNALAERDRQDVRAQVAARRQHMQRQISDPKFRTKGRQLIADDAFASDEGLPGLSVDILNNPLAMDRMTVREYDIDGKLHVEITPISKANVCPYYGKEIPNAAQLGLLPNKVYFLLRDPVELAKAAHTFNNLPLLRDHVAVSADDHKPEYVVGSTGTDAVFDPPYLLNSLVVWANASIAGIETGDRMQLSSAYRYEVDMTPGVFEGVPYDGRMINIIGNHVALVPVGRAGADVVVGDHLPVELSPMPKKFTAVRALAMRVALGTHLRPAMAQDAAPIPLQDLVKKGLTPKAIATATKKHYAGKFDIDADALAKTLQIAADEAAEDPDNDDMADDEDETDDEKEKRLAKEKAAADKAKDEETDPDPKKPVDRANDAALVTMATDAALKAQRAEFAALRAAEAAVRPLVGELVACDSAETVYRTALTQLGVDHEGVHASALPALVAMAAKHKTNPRTVIAQDSAAGAAEEFGTLFGKHTAPRRA